MPDCPACGAPIQHAKLADGTNVPLETFTEPDGPRRFRITDFGPPLKAEAVSATSTAPAYPDHRKDCPAHDNGLR